MAFEITSKVLRDKRMPCVSMTPVASSYVRIGRIDIFRNQG